MRHVVISILFMAMPGASSAQTANDRDVVLQTVQTFFNTMTTNDAEGADSFDLIKTAAGWKIAGGTYTVEAKCAPSPLAPLKQ